MSRRIDILETAARLRIPPGSVHKLRTAGALRGQQTGSPRRWTFDAREVERIAKKGRTV